ncbi:ribonuclease H-like domain-containing protein [Tanacetum coccineum]
MTHLHPNRRFVPQAVLTRSSKINTAGASVNTVVRPVNTVGSKPTVNHPRPISNAYKKGYSQVTKPFNKYSANKNSIFNKKVNTVRVKDTTARDRAVVSENKGKWANAVKASACWGNPQQKEYKEKGVIDSGCSRHMTGNKCYLTEYEDYDGGFVSFGDGKGRISGKGKIKSGTLVFDDVYFCKELKYNLFSVSQICDKKNNVLFTDTECLVLSSDFKLLDESQVLLRVPRKDNIYSVNLKSVVPTKRLTCLFAKATIDESNLWHRRLGHINFKNMNKLVRGNLVRGLPSKIFENDHSCIACQKGKQHKASLLRKHYLKDFTFQNAYLHFPPVSNVTPIDDTGIFNSAYNDEDVGADADLNNLETTMNRQKKLQRLSKCFICPIFIAKRTKKVDFKALEDPSWVEAMQEELLQFKLQKVWTLVDLPNGKRAIGTKWVFRNKKDERGIVVRNKQDWLHKVIPKKKALIMMSGWYRENDFIMVLLHALREDKGRGPRTKVDFLLVLCLQQKEDRIFIRQDKYMFEILKKFDFVTVKTASTPIETNKALIKDEKSENVDVHLYRSMIGSLMYLTTSRPDIMFDVCVCARFQVTPKTSHIHVVKRIFRYLKGQPKLGLWYPKDLPFDLEAFSDNDYAGASLDRKSTTGGCQFLGKRLISW